MNAEIYQQGVLPLPQPLALVTEFEMPSDDLVNSWATEQEAIRYQMDQAMTPGIDRGQLARKAGMNKSQWSLLYDGQRGIPVGRFLKFLAATQSNATLKYYAVRQHCVLKTQREWGRIVRKIDGLEAENEQLKREKAELEKRLSMYEDTAINE